MKPFGLWGSWGCSESFFTCGTLLSSALLVFPGWSLAWTTSCIFSAWARRTWYAFLELWKESKNSSRLPLPSMNFSSSSCEAEQTNKPEWADRTTHEGRSTNRELFKQTPLSRRWIYSAQGCLPVNSDTVCQLQLFSVNTFYTANNCPCAATVPFGTAWKKPRDPCACVSVCVPRMWGA